jgi:hypothetical protein
VPAASFVVPPFLLVQPRPDHGLRFDSATKVLLVGKNMGLDCRRNSTGRVSGCSILQPALIINSSRWK